MRQKGPAHPDLFQFILDIHRTVRSGKGSACRQRKRHSTSNTNPLEEGDQEFYIRHLLFRAVS